MRSLRAQRDDLARKLEKERAEVEGLLKAVRAYEATAGKFLSSPRIQAVLSGSMSVSASSLGAATATATSHALSTGSHLVLGSRPASKQAERRPMAVDHP